MACKQLCGFEYILDCILIRMAQLRCTKLTEFITSKLLLQECMAQYWTFTFNGHVDETYSPSSCNM